MTLLPRQSDAELVRLAEERSVKRLGIVRPEPVELPAIQWPVKLLLPWSHLVSDNVRKMAVAKMVNGKPVAEMMLTSEYRRCKGLIRDKAKAQLGYVELATYPLKLEAAVWVPDDVRAHDVPNFQKCTLDALEGIVYTKDRWVYDSRFYRVGVDVDAPRADVIITPVLL